MEQAFVTALLLRVAAFIYGGIFFFKSSDKTRGDYFHLGVATFIMALCSCNCMSYNLMKASDSWIMNALSICIWSWWMLYSFYQATFSPDFNDVPNDVPPTATKNSPPPPITLPKQDERNN